MNNSCINCFEGLRMQTLQGSEVFFGGCVFFCSKANGLKNGKICEGTGLASREKTIILLFKIIKK